MVTGQHNAPVPNPQECPRYSTNRGRVGSRAGLDLSDERKTSTAAGVRALDHPARSLAVKLTTLSQLLFQNNVKINVPMRESEGVRGFGGITRLIPHRGTILRRDLRFKLQ